MICVDSSVVVKWFVPEDLSDRAQALRLWAAQSAEVVVAPFLMPMEVNNALLKKTRRDDPITVKTALDLIELLLESEIQLHDSAALHQTALNFAVAFQLPAVYDAYFLALAAQLDCEFWTDDKRLLNTLDGRVPFVRWLGDFQI